MAPLLPIYQKQEELREHKPPAKQLSVLAGFTFKGIDMINGLCEL